jgi:glycerophosphoryl diester phosphodiesterase
MHFRIFLCLILAFPFTKKVTAQPKQQQKVLVAAHRGDWRNHPENSLRAFLSAADMGVDIIELDLCLSKDSVVVIMHDVTIDRTTDGKGKPNDYTLAELKKLHLKNGLGRITNNAIPTLTEVMQALKGRKVVVNLDKSYPYFMQAYQVLAATKTLKQAIFKADVTYQTLKSTYPTIIDSIIYMPVVNLDKPNAKTIITDYLANMKPYAFELIFAKDTSAILTNYQFITAKSKIWYNSLWASLNAGHDDDLAVEQNNTTNSWDWLIKHGATILQTDRPKELLTYLRSKHLHK